MNNRGKGIYKKEELTKKRISIRYPKNALAKRVQKLKFKIKLWKKRYKKKIKLIEKQNEKENEDNVLIEEKLKKNNSTRMKVFKT